MKKVWVWGGISLVGLVVLTVVGVHRWYNPPAPAAQLFLNGTILTMDPARAQVEAMLVKRGEIIALGAAEALNEQVSRDVKRVDLKGGTLLPGFIETYGRFPDEGLSALAVDASSPPVGDLYSIETLLERLRLLAQRRPEGVLLAYGFDESAIGEQRLPTRTELDLVSDTRPVAVIHVSGNLAVLNSVALRQQGIDEAALDPVGGFYGRDQNGRLNGVVAEAAFVPVRENLLRFERGEQWRMLSRASHLYLARGITFAQRVSASPESIRSLAKPLSFGMVPLRVGLWPNPQASEALAQHTLQWPEGERVYWGLETIQVDGPLEEYQAFLGQPYYRLPEGYPPEYLGFPAMPETQLNERVSAAYCQRRGVALRANGDAAIDLALNAVAAARAQCPGVQGRALLLHGLLMTESQQQRMSALDVQPSFHANRLYYRGDRDQDMLLGPQRAARLAPLAWGQPSSLSLHSHSPEIPFLPLQLLWNAVHRETAGGVMLQPSLALDVEQALAAVTRNAAEQLGVADQVGQLREGLRADLVWLDKDPRMFIDDWASIQVLGTWVDGVRRYPEGITE